jgi:alkylation response protein AidB-like acyl-CoA dehydrogenase
MFYFETEEQADIRASVRKLAEEQIPQYQSERFYGTLPRPLFALCGQLGICGLSIEERYGGAPADPITSSIVSEELAAVDLGPAIFVSVHNMVCGLIQRFGTEAQKARLLPKLATGEWLGAFGLSEPSAGSDASALKTSVEVGTHELRLHGEKCYITSASAADVYVVFARNPKLGPKAISAIIVDPPSSGGKPQDRPGFTISSAEKKMGCELSPIASLHFDNLTLPLENLLGDPAAGYSIALSGLAGGRISIASCANGISRTAISLALKHLAEREQFGSKLIEFQGLQFMLADMQMQFEAATLLTRNAAQLLAHDPKHPDNRLLPSYAKCFATDAAMKITTDAVQLLGGAGYIKDYGVEKLMRDAKMLQIVEGTNQIQRMVIARELAKRAKA